MKFKIENRKKIEQGFIGMNKYAAKAHHIPFNHKDNVIEIKSGMSKGLRKRTIMHEEIEENLMKNKHYSYHHAHHIALKNEGLPRDAVKRMGLIK